MAAHSPQPLKTIIERISVPLCVFGAILFLGVVGLRILLDPGRFPVHLDGNVVRLRELKSEYEKLIEQEKDLLEQKKLIGTLTPVPTLNTLSELRTNRTDVLHALASVEEARAIFRSRYSDPVAVTAVSLHEDTLRIQGAVVDSGGHPVQMLASFVDRLREESVFASVREPEYATQHDQAGNAFAPFVIDMKIAHET